MTTTINAATYAHLPGAPNSDCWAWVIDDRRWRLGGQTHASEEENELAAVLDLLRETATASGESLSITLQKRSLWEHLEGHVPATNPPTDKSKLLARLDNELDGRNVDFTWAGSTRKGLDSHQWPGSHSWPKLACQGVAMADTDLREEILRNELALLSAEGRNDTAMLRQLIHPNFYEIGRTGRYWEREEVIRVLQTIPDQIKGVTFDRVVELRPGVVHVRFRTEDDIGIVHRSSIWARDGDLWQQLYHQGTPDTQAG
ncbi:DUF4440 domain-containing protein [Paenarthrobacter sp. NPDC092416]|uniref:nuclear transport factor 2 family protein n=1 Tax=Paenarthrobacter sp. NPDC092416 TaxID=3364386 RepID=UPI0038172E21